jgi:hypothetical protein
VNDEVQPDTDTAVVVDVVAAVEYLSGSHRLGLDEWGAIEEAARWWTVDNAQPNDDLPVAALAETPWSDPDPLRSTLERLLSAAAPLGVTDGHPVAEVMSGALRMWVDRMAMLYSDGRRFSHPAQPAGWPSVAGVQQ